MREIMATDKTAQITLLSNAFAAFNDAALDLQKSFAQLESKVKELDIELESRNRELAASLSENRNVKNFLNNVLESLRSGVLVLNKGKRITLWNTAVCRITGVDFSKYQGRSFYSLLKELFSLDESTIRKMKELGYEEEHVFKLTSANGPISILYTMVPLTDENTGKEDGRILIFQDITRWKRLEDQAERNNRLIAMGELAGKIVSEVRNPLGSIEIFTSMLQRDLAGDQEKCRTVGHIINAVRSLDCLLANYLLFTQAPRPHFQEMSVEEWLNESIDFISFVPKAKPISIIKEFRARKPWISGDGELLKQVALNLILNAIQAMPRGGRLTIATDDEDTLHEGHAGKPRRMVAVRFSDTGAGITNSDMEKIFNPFFTTREGSSGLGLAIVNNIVRAHSGVIEVHSTDGQGTAFTVYLPALRRAGPPPRQKHGSAHSGVRGPR